MPEPHRNRILEIVRMKPRDILPNPRNYRIHPKNQRQATAGSLDLLGKVDCLKVYRSQRAGGQLVLLDGHLRREDFGDEEWDVAITDLTDAEADQFLLVFDPLSALATTDSGQLERLIADAPIQDEALNAMIAGLAREAGLGKIEPPASTDPSPLAEPEPTTSRSEQLQQQWRTMPGQTWTIPSKARPAAVHLLRIDDPSLPRNWDELVGDEPADLVFTEVTTHAGAGPDADAEPVPEPSFGLFLSGVLANLADHVRPGSAAYIPHPDSVSLILRTAAREAGWSVKQTIVWLHDAPSAASRTDYRRAHEPILYAWRPGAAHRWYGDRAQSSVWTVEENPARATRTKTSQISLPLDIAVRAIRNSSARGQRVLDALAAIGTTFVACETLGRTAIGIEASPRLAAVALDRMAGLGLTPRLSGGPGSEAEAADTTAVPDAQEKLPLDTSRELPDDRDRDDRDRDHPDLSGSPGEPRGQNP